jgi:predicted transcriptional regulator
MKNLIIRQKSSAVLLLLRDNSQKWYPSKLAKLSGVSYLYVTMLLSKFQAAGWADAKKEGRTKYFSLTDNGLAVASALDALQKKLELKKEEAAPAKTEQASKSDSQPATPAQKAG